MTDMRIELNLDEELLLLLFWAYGKEISHKLGPGRLEAVPGLKAAIDAIANLPAAIGWDDSDLPRGFEDHPPAIGYRPRAKADPAVG